MKPEEIPKAKEALNELQSYCLGEVKAAVVKAEEEAGKPVPEISIISNCWTRFFSFLDAFDKLTRTEKRLKENPGSVTWAELDVLPSLFRETPYAQMGAEQAQTPHHICPVCGDPVAGGPDEYLGHIRTYHPEEWRRLETDPSYTLRRTEAGIMRCRYCGAPYAYRENLEIHEKGCPKR